jgi:hypothetical protein
MVNLPGSITLVTDDDGGRILNASDLELRDATVVHVNGPDDRKLTYLGTIMPGGTVALEPNPVPRASATDKGQLNPTPFLQAFQAYAEDRPENKGEIRLVAWAPKVMAGEKFEPAVDRHRGFTAVVVHLRSGPPPAPSGPKYDFLARRVERTPSEMQAVPDGSADSTGMRASPYLRPRNPTRRLRTAVPAPGAPARGGVKVAPEPNGREEKDRQ